MAARVRLVLTAEDVVVVIIGLGGVGNAGRRDVSTTTPSHMVKLKFWWRGRAGDVVGIGWGKVDRGSGGRGASDKA